MNKKNKLSTINKKSVGRPKKEVTKEIVIQVRFSSAEIKEIDKYIKKNKIKTRSEIIRYSILSKVRQTDIFDVSI